MGVIFIDGAERNNLDLWTTTYGVSIASSSGLDMSGDYVIDATGNYVGFERTLDDTQQELYIIFRYRPVNVGAWRGILFFNDVSGNPMLAVNVDDSECLTTKRGDYNDTELNQSDLSFSNNTTYEFKVYYKAANSGGIISVSVDGVVECYYEGDTTNGAEAVKTIRFGRYNSSNNGCYAYFDDIVISTTDITSGLKVAGKAITGAGTTTQWDASAGSNYECVNDGSDDTYNYTSVADEIDTFALANCTENIGSIDAVQVEIVAMNDGAPTQMQAVVRINGTNYFGSSFSPPASLSLATATVWTTNPDDSNPFEKADINALEVGYKAIA